MGRLKDLFTKVAYALSFGMRGADIELMGSARNGAGEGSSISHEVDEERLSHGLLKGEVNQEVEDLRYRTYKVSSESEKYDYIGNGIAVKNDEKVSCNDTKPVFSFSQSNMLDYGNVAEGVSMADRNNRFIFEIGYKEPVRFRIERYITQVDCTVDKVCWKASTTLHFWKEGTPDDPTSKPFVNELSKIATAASSGGLSEGFIKRSEILSMIDTLSFSTYKAKGEDDYVIYNFLGGGKFVKFEDNTENGEYLITFEWSMFSRVPVDFSEKYYSENIARKYETKAPKDTPLNLTEYKKVYRCAVCGKEIKDDRYCYIQDLGMVCQDCMDNFEKE